MSTYRLYWKDGTTQVVVADTLVAAVKGTGRAPADLELWTNGEAQIYEHKVRTVGEWRFAPGKKG